MLELLYLSSQVEGRSWCCRPGTWRVSDGGHSQERASLGPNTGPFWLAHLLHTSLCTAEYKETIPRCWTRWIVVTLVSVRCEKGTYLRPRGWVPFCLRRRLREGLRRVGPMVRAPSVDRGGSADGALSHGAGPLELDRGLGDMVALLGSKLSVFSCSVLYEWNIHVSYSARCHCMT